MRQNFRGLALDAGGQLDRREAGTNPSVLLGTLGHQIDVSEIDVAHIEQRDDGFEISGAIAGHYVRRLIFNWELQQNFVPLAPLPKPSAGETTLTSLVRDAMPDPLPDPAGFPKGTPISRRVQALRENTQAWR